MLIIVIPMNFNALIATILNLVEDIDEDLYLKLYFDKKVQMYL